MLYVGCEIAVHGKPTSARDEPTNGYTFPTAVVVPVPRPISKAVVLGRGYIHNLGSRHYVQREPGSLVASIYGSNYLPYSFLSGVLPGFPRLSTRIGVEPAKR